MGKLSIESKEKYSKSITPYRNTIKKLLLEDSQYEAKIASGKSPNPYEILKLVENDLTIISFQLVMNSVSLAQLGLKNEVALNDARKTCYKAIIKLERVFTNFVDVPFSEYEDSLKAVSSVSELERCKLIKKAGFSIAMVSDGFGENSRWKWSLVELEARLAVVGKNTLNLKTLFSGMDPRSEGYQERVHYFNLIWRLLENSADQYRKKYELSTGRMDDFRIAINYLSTLRRLAVTLNRQQEVVVLKRKIETWKEKMEKDDQNMERKQRFQRLQSSSPAQKS